MCGCRSALIRDFFLHALIGDFLPFGIENNISPLVVAATFSSMWGCTREVEERTKAGRSVSVTPDPQGHVAQTPKPQGQRKEKDGNRGEGLERGGQGGQGQKGGGKEKGGVERGYGK